MAEVLSRDGKFASIILVHYGMNEERSGIMMGSINSLISSLDYPAEIIVVDNGPDEKDSEFFMRLVSLGKIQTYIRNTDNMHFGYARNQGLALAQGDYIVIVDNDLKYTKGWLSECVKVLEAFPHEKIYATPIHYPTPVRYKLNVGTLEHDGKTYILNMRAGSNCFVVRRKDFQKIGNFMCHCIAGTKWTNSACDKKFNAAVVPGELVEDIGFRNGYNTQQIIPIKLTLCDGKEVYFNEEQEFKDNVGILRRQHRHI